MKDWARFVYDRAMALDYHFHGLDVIQNYLSDLQAPPVPPAQQENPEGFGLVGSQQQPPVQENPEGFDLFGPEQLPPAEHEGQMEVEPPHSPHQHVNEPETEYEKSLKRLLKDYQKIEE
uniref:Uncharacterized protein n=1 Tax=Panagrolaimus sp. JU765 TaxID=591449 RepID=A0AC34Q4U0_9BILA